MEPVWWKVTVTAEPGHRELLSLALVEQGSGGVIEQGDALVAYFPPVQRQAAERTLRAFAAGALAPAPTWTWEREEGEPWRDAWKEHFRPALLSPRIAVCPSWARPPAFGPAVQTLHLDPGRAFGTGTHETTRLCLGVLDRCLQEEPVPACLDVGCGSGILAVAAARLGVPRVAAVDIDCQAAAATRENAQRNGVAARVLATCGDLRAIRGTYPLVLANILYQILLGLAPELCSRVAPRGRLLLSGLLVEELGSAVGVYGRHGLREERREVDGEWGALLLRNPRP